MATISNTPRPGYVWDATDNVWYPIGVGAHQHTNAADTPAVMPYSTYAAAGKNKVINGDFGIWQRGTSFSLTGSTIYTADRWATYGVSGDTLSQQTFTPGTAPVSGYEGTYYARFVTGATVSPRYFYQKIEDVRVLAGQTVTLSFWARVSSGTGTVEGFLGNQNFGSGGSAFNGGTTQAFTATTSWQRFSFSGTVASVAGKTIGSGSFTEATLSVSDTSKTFEFWGVQLEAGSNVTAFQTATGNLASELAACQRYYFRASSDSGYKLFGNGTVTGVNNCDIAIILPTQMRVLPTSLETSAMSTFYYEPTGGTTPTSISLNSASTPNIGRVTVAKTSSFTVGYAIGLFSNGTAAYLGFSAEL